MTIPETTLTPEEIRRRKQAEQDAQVLRMIGQGAPESMGTVTDRLVPDAPPEPPGFVQAMSEVLSQLSTNAARTNPVSAILPDTTIPASAYKKPTDYTQPQSDLPDQLPDNVGRVAGPEQPRAGSPSAIGGDVFGQLDKLTGGQVWRQAGQQAVEGLPRLAADVAAGTIVPDFALQGYAGAKERGASTPEAIAAGTVGGVGAALFPAMSKLGERTALQGLEKVAPSALADPLAVTATKIAGRTAGMGATMEGQRQGEELAVKGELVAPTAQSLASEAVTALPLAAMNTGLQVSRTPVTPEVAATRGARIGQAHADIIRTASEGGDPTGPMRLLRAHWEEVATEPNPTRTITELSSYIDDANRSGISDDQFQRIVAGVQGRYNDLFKSDPSKPGPETFNELIKRGHLPALSKKWIEENFSDALAKMMGDEQGAKVNLLNRIVAHYENLLPDALDTMRKTPVNMGLAQSDLNAQFEADKDAQYMSALLKLAPYMKNAVVPGAQSGTARKTLLDAFLERDMEMSNATQGEQLSTSATAWSRYDAFKNAVIKLAETYDPTTRRGMYLPFKRLSDGSVLELPAEQTSLEDLVTKPAEGGYAINPMPTRQMNRAGSSSALRDAVEFVNDKFRPDATEEDISNIEDPEEFKKQHSALLKKSADDTAAMEQELLDDERAQHEFDADQQGLVGKNKDDYITAQIESGQNATLNPLGIDLSATNQESYYDIALHLMNKVDRLDNTELWEKYGGPQLFGQGAASSGKFQLFKKAILAQMESVVDPGMTLDTTHLSKAQVDFYNAWRANVAAKKGATVPDGLSETWEKRRAQFRHALRLYWGQGAGKIDPREFYLKLLDDKPQYQRMLTNAKLSTAVEGPQSVPTPILNYASLLKELRAHYGAGAELDLDAGRLWGILIPTPDGSKIKFPVLAGGLVLNPNGTPLGTFGQRMQELVTNYYQNQKTLTEQWAPAPRPAPPVTYVIGTKYPFFDALRLGYRYALQQGKSKAEAQQYAEVTARLVKLFDTETGIFAQRLTDTKDSLGSSMVIHGRSHAATVNYANINAVGGKTPLSKLIGALMTAAHEITHAYSRHTVALQRDFAPQRIAAYQNLKDMFTVIGEPASDDLLNKILPAAMFPPELTSQLTTTSLKTQGGNVFAEEAVSRLMELAMVGAVTRTSKFRAPAQPDWKTWRGVTAWLPDQVQAVENYAFRDLSDVLDGVIDFYKNTLGPPNSSGIVYYLSEIVNEAERFLDVSTERLEHAQVAAETLLSNLTASGTMPLPTVITTTLSEAAAHDAANAPFGLTDKSEMFRNVEATAMAVDLLHGTPEPESRIQYEHERRMGIRVPPWSQWAGLFYQSMLRFHKQGNPLAESVMYKVNDLEKAYFRLNRLMHDPFLVVDELGRLRYDPSHPLLRILQKADPVSVRARVTLSDITRWQNESAKPAIEQQQDGSSKLSPDVPDKIRQQLQAYPMEVQQGIMHGVQSLLKGSQHAADIMYHDQLESTSTRLAGVLMAVDKNMLSDQAFSVSKLITEAAVNLAEAKTALKAAQAEPNNVGALQQAQARADQLTQVYTYSLGNLNTDQVGAVGSYLFGKEGLATELLRLKLFYTQRSSWFTTESRPGRIFISSYNKDNEPHFTSAQNERLAKQTSKRLVEQGHTGIAFHDRNVPDERDLFDTPDAVIQHYIDRETKAWMEARDAMEQKLSPEDINFIDSLGYIPGAEISKSQTNKSIQRYMKRRELRPGREMLDSIEAFTDWTGRLSGSVARRGLQRQLNLMMSDPRLRNQNEFKQLVKTNVDALMQPLNNNLQMVRAALTSRYLGLPQLISPLVEMMQSAGGVLPYFIDQIGFTKATQTYGRALEAPFKYSKFNETPQSQQMLRTAMAKESTDARLMTKEESMILYYRRQNDEGGFQHGPIYSANNSRNHAMLVQAAFGLGASQPRTFEQMITDPLYWMSQKSLWLYSQASGYNSRVAFAGALDMMYDRGLRGSELFQAAAAYQNLYTHGGGKANTIGYVGKMSNPITRSAWGLTETLQRYAFGNLTMQKDMLDEIIGRMDIPSGQRKKAAQAFMTAQLVQVLLAGTMGLSGAAILATIVQKGTGWDAKQKLRQFWVDLAERLGADEPLAVLLANVAQNGFVSNALGVDVSNRVILNSFLGFNEFDGFNSNEITGAVSSFVQDLWDATKFVATGDAVKAGKSLAPPSMRPYINLAESQLKYGDTAVRDNSNRMLTQLQGSEVPLYALGLKPYRTRLLREQQNALKSANDAANARRDQVMDDLSQQLLHGNVQAVQDYIQQQRTVDPMVQTQPLLRAIVDRAVDAKRPVDPLAIGPVANAPEQKQIAQSFGNAAPRQSEIDDLRARYELGLHVGLNQPDMNDVNRARMIDFFVTERKMTRSEAARMTDMLLRMSHAGR